MADYITMYNEEVDVRDGITLFDPTQTWKKRTFTDVHAKQLNVPIYVNGKRVYQTPPIGEIRAYCAAQVDTLWDEVKRFEYPHRYYVDLSQTLWNERQRLLNECSRI
jgi:nicotinate phosphoribosyltransferase